MGPGSQWCPRCLIHKALLSSFSRGHSHLASLSAPSSPCPPGSHSLLPTSSSCSLGPLSSPRLCPRFAGPLCECLSLDVPFLSLPSSFLLLSETLVECTYILHYFVNVDNSQLSVSYLNLFIYLTVPGLSCCTRDRWSLLQHVGSSSLTQDGNPGPLHWERGAFSHWTTREIPQISLSLFRLLPWAPDPYAHLDTSIKTSPRDFSGSPVVKTLRFQCRGLGSIPGPGTKIPHVTELGPGKTKNKKRHPLES